jgi:tetrahydromethanopterin S-methyltransferase subunit G
METMTATEGDLATLEKKVDDGFARADVEFAKVNGRIDHLEATTSERFERVDERFDRVDERFDDVYRRFDKVDHRFDRLEEKIDGLTRTLIRMLGATLGSMIVAVVAALATFLVTHL